MILSSCYKSENTVSYSITIPDPCPESWDKMLPVVGGRNCDACCKTVVDFTAMTDAELIGFLQLQKDTPFCGRFLEMQLNRELSAPLPAKRHSNIFIQKLAACLLLAQTCVIAATAQTRKHVSKSTTAPVKTKIRVLKGRVMDYATQLPVARVTVKMIPQQRTTTYVERHLPYQEIIRPIVDDGIYQQMTVTDAQGYFSFRLGAADSSTGTVTLEALNANSYLADFFIPSDTVDLTRYQGEMITLYQYPAEILPQEVVRTEVIYRDDFVQRFGGAPHVVHDAPAPRPTLWQRLTKPFRHKKHE